MLKIPPPVRTSARIARGSLGPVATRPKTTNTATHTATIEMGKMKNCSTRNGVVWRGGASSAVAPSAAAGAGASVTKLMRRPVWRDRGRASTVIAGGSLAHAAALRPAPLANSLAGPDPIPQPAQRQLDVDDQRLGRVLELVEAAVEHGVVGLVGLVGLGQVLEARGPFHQALQAGLAVRVHVRGLGPAEVEAAEERADLAAAVFGALHDAGEVPPSGRAAGQERLDGAGLEAFRQSAGVARELLSLALAFAVGRALLHHQLRHARLDRSVLGGHHAA